jgi:hypothetical protein
MVTKKKEKRKKSEVFAIRAIRWSSEFMGDEMTEKALSRRPV